MQFHKQTFAYFFCPSLKFLKSDHFNREDLSASWGKLPNCDTRWLKLALSCWLVKLNVSTTQAAVNTEKINLLWAPCPGKKKPSCFNVWTFLQKRGITFLSILFLKLTGMELVSRECSPLLWFGCPAKGLVVQGCSGVQLNQSLACFCLFFFQRNSRKRIFWGRVLALALVFLLSLLTALGWRGRAHWRRQAAVFVASFFSRKRNRKQATFFFFNNVGMCTELLCTCAQHTLVEFLLLECMCVKRTQ